MGTLRKLIIGYLLIYIGVLFLQIISGIAIGEVTLDAAGVWLLNIIAAFLLINYLWMSLHVPWLIAGLFSAFLGYVTFIGTMSILDAMPIVFFYMLVIYLPMPLLIILGAVSRKFRIIIKSEKRKQ